MDADRLYPYVLEPKPAPAIWGGEQLVTRYGKAGDRTTPIGESWECWDANRIANGAFAGATLASVREQLGSALMGPIDAAQIFPVLTKFIDAKAALSVQVHPDDAYAQRVEHQPNGKTECWYILSADAGAELVLGWTHDTDRTEYERRVADGTLGEILRRVPVAAGETYYLPAGTLHAIGAGIVLFETQQASDLTYRIFDWNRVGSDGKPRELHVAKAADVLDFRATFPVAMKPLSFGTPALERTLLVGDHRFLVEHVTCTGGATLATDGLPLTITALGAGVRVVCGGGSATLPPYGTCVTPADAATVELHGPADLLVVRPQPWLDSARAAARAAGVTAGAADAFFKQFV